MHPESAMRGEDRACGERHEGDTDKSEECPSCDDEHRRLKGKAWGVVIGWPKVSRGYGGGMIGSSLSSSSEVEDSDCRLENGLLLRPTRLEPPGEVFLFLKKSGKLMTKT